MTLIGNITIPDTDGIDIEPGIVLIGNPIPRPDLSPTALVCLANVYGALGLVQLSIKFKDKANKPVDLTREAKWSTQD